MLFSIADIRQPTGIEGRTYAIQRQDSGVFHEYEG